MSDKYFTMVKDGQQVVATLNQTGTIVPEEGKDPTKYYTALVQTEDGLQQVVKTYDMNGGGGGGGYVLPPATANTLGGVKVGANLTVEADGTLNATGGGGSGADTSLSNLTDAGQIKAAHLAMPSDVVETLSIPTANTYLTAPADGYYYAMTNNTFDIVLFQRGTTSWDDDKIIFRVIQNSGFQFGYAIIPVSAGQVLYINPGTISSFKFIYLNGNSNQGA